jgi:mRNA-degrading endonuclease YafQ of YafQ-DinJ toxin-antitoxin module
MIKKSTKKNWLQYAVICFLFLLITISCNQSIDQKINSSIQNLTIKYPQLTAERKSAKRREFKFIKSVREGEFNIEIQLYSQPIGYKNRNHILVFINGKKEVYSVPLFNNKYKDYWEFPFDKPLKKISKTNTTFSKELNSAINELINNNDLRKSQKRYKMIDATLNSVLNCYNVKLKDSLIILNTSHNTSDIPDENINSVKVRLRKSFHMMKLVNQQEDFPSNCYLDDNNNRIYQIEYHGNKIKIKTYRIDYGQEMHLIFL